MEDMTQTGNVIQSIVQISQLLGNPYLILIFIFTFFLMVIIILEKREKKTLLTETLDTLATQIDILADEVKSVSEALLQLTVLFKTLSLLRGKGELYEKDTRPKTSKSVETKSGKHQNEDIPN